jgi:Zn-dependent protease
LATPLSIFQLMLEKGVQINLLLAVFNLLPIPPLDGSHVFKHLLPVRWAIMYQRIGSAGLLILLLLLSFGGSILSVWFAPIFLVYKRLEGVFAPYMLPSPFPL